MAEKSTEKSALQKLTPQRRAFVIAYVGNGFNGGKAAIEAGYAENSARQQASRLLTNADILAALDEYMKQKAMSADEVLYRLSEHGRGDLREFMGLSLDELKQHPKGWLIRKIKQTVTRFRKDDADYSEERVELELHDVSGALDKMGRSHGLFVERHEHTGKDGGPIAFEDAKERLARILARRVKRGGADGVDQQPDSGTGGEPPV